MPKNEIEKDEKLKSLLKQGNSFLDEKAKKLGKSIGEMFSAKEAFLIDYNGEIYSDYEDLLKKQGDKIKRNELRVYLYSKDPDSSSYDVQVFNSKTQNNQIELSLRSPYKTFITPDWASEDKTDGINKYATLDPKLIELCSNYFLAEATEKTKRENRYVSDFEKVKNKVADLAQKNGITIKDVENETKSLIYESGLKSNFERSFYSKSNQKIISYFDERVKQGKGYPNGDELSFVFARSNSFANLLSLTDRDDIDPHEKYYGSDTVKNIYGSKIDVKKVSLYGKVKWGTDCLDAMQSVQLDVPEGLTELDVMLINAGEFLDERNAPIIGKFIADSDDKGTFNRDMSAEEQYLGYLAQNIFNPTRGKEWGNLLVGKDSRERTKAVLDNFENNPKKAVENIEKVFRTFAVFALNVKNHSHVRNHSVIALAAYKALQSPMFSEYSTLSDKEKEFAQIIGGKIASHEKTARFGAALIDRAYTAKLNEKDSELIGSDASARADLEDYAASAYISTILFNSDLHHADFSSKNDDPNCSHSYFETILGLDPDMTRELIKEELQKDTSFKELIKKATYNDYYNLVKSYCGKSPISRRLLTGDTQTIQRMLRSDDFGFASRISDVIAQDKSLSMEEVELLRDSINSYEDYKQVLFNKSFCTKKDMEGVVERIKVINEVTKSINADREKNNKPIIVGLDTVAKYSASRIRDFDGDFTFSKQLDSIAEKIDKEYKYSENRSMDIINENIEYQQYKLGIALKQAEDLQKNKDQKNFEEKSKNINKTIRRACADMLANAAMRYINGSDRYTLGAEDYAAMSSPEALKAASSLLLKDQAFKDLMKTMSLDKLKLLCTDASPRVFELNAEGLFEKIRQNVQEAALPDTKEKSYQQRVDEFRDKYFPAKEGLDADSAAKARKMINLANGVFRVHGIDPEIIAEHIEKATPGMSLDEKQKYAAEYFNEVVYNTGSAITEERRVLLEEQGLTEQNLTAMLFTQGITVDEFFNRLTEMAERENDQIEEGLKNINKQLLDNAKTPLDKALANIMLEMKEISYTAANHVPLANGLAKYYALKQLESRLGKNAAKFDPESPENSELMRETFEVNAANIFADPTFRYYAESLGRDGLTKLCRGASTTTLDDSFKDFCRFVKTKPLDDPKHMLKAEIQRGKMYGAKSLFFDSSFVKDDKWRKMPEGEFDDLTIDRHSLVTLAAGKMLEKGFTWDQILDPYTCQKEREECGREALEDINHGDRAGFDKLVSTYTKVLEAGIEYIDNKIAGIDSLTPKKIIEMKDPVFLHLMVFTKDANQEIGLLDPTVKNRGNDKIDPNKFTLNQQQRDKFMTLSKYDDSVNKLFDHINQALEGIDELNNGVVDKSNGAKTMTYVENLYYVNDLYQELKNNLENNGKSFSESIQDPNGLDGLNPLYTKIIQSSGLLNAYNNSTELTQTMKVKIGESPSNQKKIAKMAMDGSLDKKIKFELVKEQINPKDPEKGSIVSCSMDDFIKGLKSPSKSNSL